MSVEKNNVKRSDKKRKIIAAVGITLFIIIIVAVSFFAGEKIIELSEDHEAFREWIDSFGFFGSLIFIALAAVQVILAAIPGGPVQIAAGYAFGMFQGSLLCLIGIQLGSALSFILARKLGYRVIDLFYPREKIENMKFLQESKKLDFIIFICFLIPGAPKDMLTYIFGLSKISFGKFMILTTIARIPSILLSVSGGNALVMKEYKAVIIIIAVAIVFSAIGAIVYKKLMSSGSNKKNKDYLYPIKLSCYAKETIWGGDTLSKIFRKDLSANVGETWELSVRKDENNTIINGALRGMHFNDYIDKFTSLSSKKFPILIKFIDADDKLSVQVHPDDTLAKTNDDGLGKNEVWHIISAKDGATIVYGVKDGVTKEDLFCAVENGNLENLLNFVPVKENETYFIPAGMVHAIGKGIVLAEIQQNSDATYRLYDYDRVDSNGNKRTLHIEKALSAFKTFDEHEIEIIRFSKGILENSIANCDYFTSIKYDVNEFMKFDMDDNLFACVLCLSGKGSISYGSSSYKISAGDSFFIARGLDNFNIKGNLCVILTYVNSKNIK